MGWRDPISEAQEHGRPCQGTRQWAEPWAVSLATGCHCTLTDESVPSHAPRGNPRQGQADHRLWLSFKARNFSLIHLNQLVT